MADGTLYEILGKTVRPRRQQNLPLPERQDGVPIPATKEPASDRVDDAVSEAAQERYLRGQFPPSTINRRKSVVQPSREDTEPLSRREKTCPGSSIYHRPLTNPISSTHRKSPRNARAAQSSTNGPSWAPRWT